MLSKDDLASQVRRYVESFNLNMITSAQVLSTEYDTATTRWIVELQTPAGQRKIVSKHIVMATGIGSQKINLPSIADNHLYTGTSLHSAHFKNAEQLKEKGVKVCGIA